MGSNLTKLCRCFGQRSSHKTDGRRRYVPNDGKDEVNMKGTNGRSKQKWCFKYQKCKVSDRIEPRYTQEVKELNSNSATELHVGKSRVVKTDSTYEITDQLIDIEDDVEEENLLFFEVKESMKRDMLIIDASHTYDKVMLHAQAASSTENVNDGFADIVSIPGQVEFTPEIEQHAGQDKDSSFQDEFATSYETSSLNELMSSMVNDREITEKNGSEVARGFQDDTDTSEAVQSVVCNTETKTCEIVQDYWDSHGPFPEIESNIENKKDTSTTDAKPSINIIKFNDKMDVNEISIKEPLNVKDNNGESIQDGLENKQNEVQFEIIEEIDTNRYYYGLVVFKKRENHKTLGMVEDNEMVEEDLPSWYELFTSRKDCLSLTEDVDEDNEDGAMHLIDFSNSRVPETPLSPETFMWPVEELCIPVSELNDELNEEMDEEMNEEVDEEMSEEVNTISEKSEQQTKATSIVGDCIAEIVSKYIDKCRWDC